jgi:hypothetical protein
LSCSVVTVASGWQAYYMTMSDLADSELTRTASDAVDDVLAFDLTIKKEKKKR